MERGLGERRKERLLGRDGHRVPTGVFGQGPQDDWLVWGAGYALACRAANEMTRCRRER